MNAHLNSNPFEVMPVGGATDEISKFQDLVYGLERQEINLMIKRFGVTEAVLKLIEGDAYFDVIENMEMFGDCDWDMVIERLYEMICRGVKERVKYSDILGKFVSSLDYSRKLYVMAKLVALSDVNEKKWALKLMELGRAGQAYGIEALKERGVSENNIAVLIYANRRGVRMICRHLQEFEDLHEDFAIEMAKLGRIDLLRRNISRFKNKSFRLAEVLLRIGEGDLLFGGGKQGSGKKLIDDFLLTESEREILQNWYLEFIAKILEREGGYDLWKAQARNFEDLYEKFMNWRLENLADRDTIPQVDC